MRILLLVAATVAHSQITATPTQATGRAGTLSCILVPTGATILVDKVSVPYGTWTPPLAPGADASGYSVWNGNAINYALWRSGTVVSWFVSVQPNGGRIIRQSGVFSFPPPVPAGPVTVGTLVNGVCRPQGTGFHPSSTVPILSGEKGAVMVANEPEANCALPAVR